MIEDYKITQTEVAGVSVETSAPNLLNGTANENKRWFDNFPALIKDKFNGFLEFCANTYMSQEDVKPGNNITVVNDGKGVVIHSTGGGTGGGDMLQAAYDKNQDGVVNAADYAQTAGKANLATKADNGVFVFEHEYNNITKVHDFNGEISTGNGRTLITAPYSGGDIVRINGRVVSALIGENLPTTFYVGRWMTFTCDDTQINFNGNVSKTYVDTKMSQKILWTNASLTSSFAAQTIALDLSEYTHLILENRGSTYFTTVSTVLIRRGGNAVAFSSDKNGYRNVTFSATGVVFSAANVFTVYGDTQIAVNNNYGIPAVIYGVKGVL